MLEYGESYLEQNEAVLETLAEGMSPAAMEFAKEIAANFDEEDC